MGVYIKDMEMPKTCRECPLEQSHDRYNCAITGKSYSWALSDRPSDCPIAPVPKHGRLVDADALEIKMRNRKYKYGRESDPDCLVVDAPTIIPAETPKEEA